MAGITASICIATYNKPKYLKRVLDSIVSQSPSFDYEVIVVDDGSPEIETELVCLSYGDSNIRYYRINRDPGYRNPAVARNYAYNMSNGEILILQSDDVVHIGNCIENLVELLEEGKFVISTVYNVDFNTGQPAYYQKYWFQFTGPVMNRSHSPNPTRPLFFLGSVYKKDVFAVGGCDEDFVDPGREDIWFADCLMKGRGLEPKYVSGVIGHHLDHKRPNDLSKRAAKSALMYLKKVGEAKKSGVWRARKGLSGVGIMSAAPVIPI